jgi:hypothetical protein
VWRPLTMSVDQARLRPHLRPAARNELFQSEHGPSTANGSDVTAPKRNGRVFKAEAGDLRGVPVVASQVAGVMPARIRCGRCSRRSSGASGDKRSCESFKSGRAHTGRKSAPYRPGTDGNHSWTQELRRRARARRSLRGAGIDVSAPKRNGRVFKLRPCAIRMRPSGDHSETSHGPSLAPGAHPPREEGATPRQCRVSPTRLCESARRRDLNQ